MTCSSSLYQLSQPSWLHSEVEAKRVAGLDREILLSTSREWAERLETQLWDVLELFQLNEVTATRESSWLHPSHCRLSGKRQSRKWYAFCTRYAASTPGQTAYREQQSSVVFPLCHVSYRAVSMLYLPVSCLLLLATITTAPPTCPSMQFATFPFPTLWDYSIWITRVHSHFPLLTSTPYDTGYPATATMNGHAEPIAGNTPLTSRIRTRREQLHSSSNNSNNSKTTVVSRLRFQVQDSSTTSSTSSSSSDEDNNNHNTDSSTMQQRQFTRVPDGNDLDELEGGLSPTTLLQSTFKASSNANYSSNSESRLNGNGVSNTVSEKEKYKAKQDDPLSSINKREGGEEIVSTGLTDKDKKAMVLLVALYLLQGIPVGLAFGSIPYLLRSKLSYSQIGIFTLCTYPYSLKLLWSPIVDSVFSPKLGRRKSWIVPIQTIVGLMLWWLSRNINQYIDKVSLFPDCLRACTRNLDKRLTVFDASFTGDTGRQDLDFPLLHFDFLRSDTRYVSHHVQLICPSCNSDSLPSLSSFVRLFR